MGKNFVILGANEYTVPLIEKVGEMGYVTNVFAWKTGDIGESIADKYYQISTRDKEDILEICKRLNPVGVLTVGSDANVITQAYLTENLGLTGNEYKTVCNITNRLKFRNILNINGIYQPKYVAIGESHIAGLCGGMGFPMVVKPTDQSGFRGIKKIYNRTDLVNAISEAKNISYEGKAIVEEYVQGRHFSCECLSLNGKHFVICYTRRDNISNYSKFIEHVHFQPANLTVQQKNQLDAYMVNLLDVLNVKSGASSIEFFLGANEEIVVLEVSPYLYGDFISTDLIKASTGFDYLEAAVKIACGESVDIKIKNKAKDVMVQIILSQRDVEELNKVKKDSPEKLIKYKLFVDEYQVPETIEGGRYGYFIRQA